MALDQTRTVGTVGRNGMSVAVPISDIVDAAALAPSGTTASAAELNTLAGVVAGTTSASDALVVDSHKQLDALNVTTLGVGAARVAMSGCVRAARHTATSGEASAHTMALVTGLSTVVAQFVQILRSGADVTGDAAISVSGGTITVADGASTYAVTAADVINWIAIGS